MHIQHNHIQSIKTMQHHSLHTHTYTLCTFILIHERIRHLQNTLAIVTRAQKHALLTKTQIQPHLYTHAGNTHTHTKTQTVLYNIPVHLYLFLFS